MKEKELAVKEILKGRKSPSSKKVSRECLDMTKTLLNMSLNGINKTVQTVPEGGIDYTAYGRVQDIPLKDVTILPQVRQDVDEDKESEALEQLMHSIEQNGLTNPITLRYGDLPAGGKGLILVAGERRYNAVTKLGRNTIRGIILNLTPEQADFVQVSENTARKQVRLMDVADKLLVLQNHTNPETGRKYTVRQLGATVGIPYSQISRLLTIATADPFVKKVCNEGFINDPSAAILYINLVKENVGLATELYERAIKGVTLDEEGHRQIPTITRGDIQKALNKNSEDKKPIQKHPTLVPPPDAVSSKGAETPEGGDYNQKIIDGQTQDFPNGDPGNDDLDRRPLVVTDDDLGLLEEDNLPLSNSADSDEKQDADESHDLDVDDAAGADPDESNDDSSDFHQYVPIGPSGNFAGPETAIRVMVRWVDRASETYVNGTLSFDDDIQKLNGRAFLPIYVEGESEVRRVNSKDVEIMDIVKNVIP